MHILNIVNAAKKMAVNELKDFLYENYYIQMGFARESSYYSIKHQKKKDLQLLVNHNKINRKNT